MMFGIFPLLPAYGRDYKSKAAVLADWEAGKDFSTCSGPYCSKRDFAVGDEITIHYAKQRMVMVFKNT